jgi:hypothetical protein
MIICIVKANCMYGNECSANEHGLETCVDGSIHAYASPLSPRSGIDLVLLIPHLFLKYKALLPRSINLSLSHLGPIGQIRQHRSPIIHLFHLLTQRTSKLVIARSRYGRRQ